MAGGPQTDAPTATESATLILDLGSKRKKQIKKLRRGSGKLVEEVNGCISELKTNGTISSRAQVVVLVVREKPEPLRGLLPRM